MSNIYDKLPLLKEEMEERYGSILAPFAAKYPKENSRDYEETVREDKHE